MYRINKRPMYDSSDDENEEKDDEKDVEQNPLRIPQINPNELNPNPENISKSIKSNETEEPKELNQIGSGKFGSVYKSRYANQNVAVKKYVKIADYIHEKNVVEHITKSVYKNKYENILKPVGICNQMFVWEFMTPGAANKILPYSSSQKMLPGSADKLLYTNETNNMRSTLDMLDIVNILIDVCNGMKCLHSMGIIHRDLAARNLLFTTDNRQNLANNTRKKYTVKICDFGEAVVNNNKTYSRKGPYLWLAPESIRKQICNIKTDVYSFGILCYELIIGQRPLPVKDTPIEIAIMEILFLSQRPNITSYCKLIPLQLFILIQTCWQQVPQYRPNDFLEISNELNKLRMYLIKNKGNCVNTRLDQIKFDKNKTKEVLKDLRYLICEYLSSENSINLFVSHVAHKEEMSYKQNTKNELLKKIMHYNYEVNKHTDVAAINFYIDHFPWGVAKDDEEKINAAKNNITNVAQKYDIKWLFNKQGQIKNKHSKAI